MKLSLQVCEPYVLCSLQEHSLSWIWAQKRRRMRSLRTYPKHECLRRCPKPVCAPFLANRKSLLIVPCAPDTYKTLWTVRKITCTFELSLLWRFLNFSTQSVIFLPWNTEWFWIDSIRIWVVISQNTGILQVRDENNTDSVRWRTDLINPLCLRMKGKPLRNVAEFFHCPRQASTRLTRVWYSISFSRRKEQKGSCCNRRLTALKDFPQLSFLSHWFVVVVNTQTNHRCDIHYIPKRSSAVQLQIVQDKNESSWEQSNF